MVIDVAAEIARLAVAQRKRDAERIEAIYRMDKPKAKSVIRMASEEVVEAILNHAGLSVSEKVVVRVCVKQGLSQEQAAEELHASVKTIQREMKSALEKIVLYLTYLCLIFRAVNEGA